jgi:parvulin-like peptidyl-prolyl isomerase
MDKKTKKNRKLMFVILSTAGVIFLLLAAAVLGVYKYDRDDRFFLALEKAVPFPAAYVSGAGGISVGETKEDLRAVKKFYESQDFEQIGMRIDFSTEQGKKRLKIKEKEILNKLVENKIIEALAEEKGISVSDADVKAQIESNIEQFGNRQNLMSELSRLYGWSLADFQEKVVKPEILAEKLTEAYSDEVDNSKQTEKIKVLYDRVASKKEDFSKVAAEASEGKSAEQGGDLGWSTKDQLIREIADKAYSMKAGEASGVIESPLGFHIVKLEEKKTEDEQELVRIRQIFVAKTTFGDWLKEKAKDFKVTVLLKDYAWNAQTGLVEFKNQDLKRFEESLGINSQGDPSVFP